MAKVDSPTEEEEPKSLLLSTLNGEGAEVASAESRAGEIIGKYRLVKCIGSGGMGVVYLAEDSLMNRHVAIKILLKEVAKNPVVVQRFLTEAQVAGRLNHPNIIAIYDVVQDKGSVAMVMELLKPRSAMRQIQKRGPLHWTEASRIVADCCSALVATHEAGLIHRDIKPGNILCSPAGITKLVDFGMVKELPLQLDKAESSQSTYLMGTATYMSPEQIAGKPIDKRTDIYSLGVTYFEMLAGRPPFMDRAPQIYFQHYFEEPPDPRTFAPDLPEPCIRILMRALAKAPADRYQSAAEMRGELETLLRDPTAVENGFQFLGPSSSSMQSARIIPPPQPIEPSAEVVIPPSPPPRARQVSDSGRRRRRWLGFAVLALACIAGAASLISLYKRSAPNVIPPPVEPAVVTASPSGADSAALTVGILVSLSGSAADIERGVADATVLAIKQLNASGGLLGKPVESLVIDGASEVGTFMAGAEQLVNKRHAALVVGGGNSTSRRAIRQIFESQDSLLIYPGRYEGLESSPNIVYTGGLPNQRVLPVLAFCRENLHRHRFFLLGDDSPYSQSAIAILKAEITGTNGGEVVGEYYLPAGTTDLESIVTKLKESKADIIVNTLEGGLLRPLHATLRAAHLTPRQLPTISINLNEAELRNLGDIDLADNYLAWDYLEELPSQQNASFLAEFKKEYGAARTVTADMEAAYLGLQLWAQVVKSLGTGRPGAVLSALKGRQYVGPEGEVRVDPDNNHLWKPFNLVKLTHGNRVEVVYSAPTMLKPTPFSTEKRQP